MPSVIYAEENKELFFDIANTGDKYEYSDYNLLKSNIDGSNTTAPNNGMFLSNTGKNQNIILKNITPNIEFIGAFTQKDAMKLFKI